MHIVMNDTFCFSEAPWLSWEDILYGLDRGFLTPAGIVGHAVEKLSAESPSELYELASLDGDDVSSVRECLGRLVVKNVQNVSGSEEVWIFLFFLWVFVNRSKYPDPLGVVEELYADFGYPESVAPIVRYMPAADHSLEGEERLFKNWSDMLDSYRSNFQTSRPCYEDL